MSVRAERALIGSLVIDGDALDLITEIVEPEDFTSPVMGAIYRAMLNLRAMGRAVDYVTILDEIEWSGVLTQDGRTASERAAIVTATINDCPTSMHAETYARQIAAASQARAPQPPVRRGDAL